MVPRDAEGVNEVTDLKQKAEEIASHYRHLQWGRAEVEESILEGMRVAYEDAIACCNGFGCHSVADGARRDCHEHDERKIRAKLERLK